ncbi:MAG: hypothetical protein AB8H80_17990 [Planctomycetota bacterium]
MKTRTPMSMLVAIAGLSSALNAQTAQLSVSESISPGSAVDITYLDASKAGQTVQVTVDNGFRLPSRRVVVTLEIVLDAEGKGTVVWTAPNWLAANFNAPNAAELHRTIL